MKYVRKDRGEVDCFQIIHDPFPNWFVDAINERQITLSWANKVIYIYKHEEYENDTTSTTTIIAEQNDYIMRDTLGNILKLTPVEFSKLYVALPSVPHAADSEVKW